MNPKKPKREKQYGDIETAHFKPGLETRFPHVATMLLAMGDDRAAESHSHKLFPHLQKRVMTLPRRQGATT